ncbi:MAG: Hsp20/alpha crystallin family protein [Chlorobi bacterium]|nr:Hsp20/alpha crystallin family protein [Chlorobiota bacterium]
MKPIVKRQVKDPMLALFDEFFRPMVPSLENQMGRLVVPAVNIIEDDKGVEIDVAAPGLEKNDFEIKVEDNVLTISAHREEQKLEEGANYIKKEFGYENFQRSFTLPDNMFDTDKIEAKYENGVLKIYIPKVEEQQKKVKKIEVK